MEVSRRHKDPRLETMSIITPRITNNQSTSVFLFQFTDTQFLQSDQAFFRRPGDT